MKLFTFCEILSTEISNFWANGAFFKFKLNFYLSCFTNGIFNIRLIVIKSVFRNFLWFTNGKDKCARRKKQTALSMNRCVKILFDIMPECTNLIMRTHEWKYRKHIRWVRTRKIFLLSRFQSLFICKMCNLHMFVFNSKSFVRFKAFTRLELTKLLVFRRAD